MHLDVFPAGRLGWLCRALNTRDGGRHSPGSFAACPPLSLPYRPLYLTLTLAHKKYNNVNKMNSSLPALLQAPCSSPTTH
jgi:hypothetical protein